MIQLQPREEMKKFSLSFSYKIHEIWDTKEWLSYLLEIPEIKILTHANETTLVEIKPNALDDFLDLCSNFSISVEQSETITEPDLIRQVKLPRKIKIPSINFITFRQVMQFWYQIHIGSTKKIVLYQYLANIIVQQYLDQIRIVSAPSHPLWQLINMLKQETKFDRVTNTLKKLQESAKWHSFLGYDDKEIYSPISIELNRWLHILRHPTEASNYLELFLKKIQNETMEPIIITSLLPLIDHEQKNILIITIMEKNESNQIPMEIKQYWLILGAILLRNIGNALYIIKDIKYLKSEFTELYVNLKGKFQKFIESCINNDLIEAYKNYDQILKKENHDHYLRTYEFNIYNRGSLLKRRLNQAKNEYNRFPNQKIIRKRVNSRRNRLNKFLESNLLLFKSFIEETLEITKASGKYTSLDMISSKYAQLKENIPVSRDP